jgi:hypothetical protein
VILPYTALGEVTNSPFGSGAQRELAGIVRRMKAGCLKEVLLLYTENREDNVSAKAIAKL